MIRFLGCLLIGGVFLFSSCQRNKASFLQSNDSLISLNRNLISTLNNINLNKELDSIKIITGSRLILLDKYQESISISDTTNSILKYASLHHQTQNLYVRRNNLSKLLLTEMNALKLLRNDIDESSFPDDSIKLFLKREGINLTTLGESIVNIHAMSDHIQAEFKLLHPKVSSYTDSLLRVKL